jgi:hypothetical protein
MDKSTNNKYFAAREAKDAAKILLEKATDWTNILTSNGYLEKLKSCLGAYHGAYFNDSHTISFAGEQGELAQLPVNHIRNLAQHMFVMTTASRPQMEARAANSDYKSSAQVTLANGLLDYYMREKRLERYINNAVEQSIVLGSGYVKVEWDATAGKVIEEDEELGEKIYEGDIKFTNLSPFDVVFDVNREDSDHDWILVRTYKNKFDLAAKYPEYEDEIIALDVKNGTNSYNSQIFRKVASDQVEVWTMYHRRSDAMPGGRELVFLSDEIMISDTVLQYRRIPIFRMSPNNILGTAFGYSNLFDLLPLQEGINHLYSAIMSNNIAFATQNLFVESGANIDITNLGGGLNIIQGSKQPVPLNLLGTSPETFQFLSILEGKMEQLSGINGVTRGTPDPAANLRSGTSLALVQSMAIQFQNGLQQQYVQLIEDLGVAILEILQDNASSPRVASIVGVNNKQYIVEFKGSDISDINRVIVDVGNPLARTTAGRVQMAEQMMQMKPEEFSFQQYVQVINTGRIDGMTSKIVDQENLIQQENEALTNGKTIKAMVWDDHKEHILHHRNVLNDLDIRNDDARASVVYNHLMEHIEFARNADPAVLTVTNQQTLPQPTPPPAPANPAAEPAAAPDQNSQGQSAIGEIAEPLESDLTQAQPSMPGLPTPPAPFEDLPTTTVPVPGN